VTKKNAAEGVSDVDEAELEDWEFYSTRKSSGKGFRSKKKLSRNNECKADPFPAI
jgi:hypothetical protein